MKSYGVKATNVIKTSARLTLFVFAELQLCEQCAVDHPALLSFAPISVFNPAKFHLIRQCLSLSNQFAPNVYSVKSIECLLSRRSRQRERLSASVLSICLFVSLSVYLAPKCKKPLFSQINNQFRAMVSIDNL